MSKLLEGRDAYCDGKNLDDNPYQPETEDGCAWAKGWINAADNDPLAEMGDVDA